jgi:hypothetical protein
VASILVENSSSCAPAVAQIIDITKILILDIPMSAARTADFII